jgi:plastocyanin
MRRLSATAALAVVVAVVAVQGGSAAAAPRLVGTVGPGFTIGLTEGSKKVKTLKAGTYTFVVSDRSPMHNFFVEGPGLSRAITTVPFQGTKTVTVKLRAGKLKYYCQPHEATMFGFVTVT